MKKQKKENVIIGPNAILTENQEKIIRTQIRRNSAFIQFLIYKVDLLANRERCPKDANTLVRLQKQLAIEMEENDNFRKVLWKHLKAEEVWREMPNNLPDPVTFLVDRIRTRQQSLIAQLCMK